MKPKHKKKNTAEDIPAFIKWLVGTAIAVVSLLAVYKYNGAEDLRNSIYRPLYSELSQVEQSLQQPTFVINIPSQSKSNLEATGDLNRIPEQLRQEITGAYRNAIAAQGGLTAVELVQRMSSERIQSIRTQEQDAKWKNKTVAELEAQLRTKPGISGIRSFTMQHAGHSPVLDVRDPNSPHIAAPGDITWQLQDWLEYPASSRKLEDLWDNTQLLCLDEQRQDWFYCLTREDLRRSHLDLTRFLAPIYDALLRTANIQQVQRSRQDALRAVRAVRLSVADRIRDPKLLTDLLP